MIMFKFYLNILTFASHKGVGSTKNGRDSAGRRLGMKLSDGQYAKAGSIIYRQRGTKINPRLNTKRGGDDTIFATHSGVVKYFRGVKNRVYVDVIPLE
jgi:large subunit ribosomal protein L27